VLSGATSPKHYDSSRRAVLLQAVSGNAPRLSKAHLRRPPSAEYSGHNGGCGRSARMSRTKDGLCVRWKQLFKSGALLN
jgi:hypothetical protein